MSVIDWSKKLPPDAKAEYYEKGQVEQLGGPPPVRFVPKLAYRNAKRATTYQLNLGAGKAKHTKFNGKMCKDTLLRILKFRKVSKKLLHC